MYSFIVTAVQSSSRTCTFKLTGTKFKFSKFSNKSALKRTAVHVESKFSYSVGRVPEFSRGSILFLKKIL